MATETPNTSATTNVVNETSIRLEPQNIWRVGWVVIALVACGLFLKFVVADAGSVIFSLLMAWFAALAMEPLVGRLARRMKRGLATGLVMGVVALGSIIFIVAFGQLFVDQVAQLLRGLPWRKTSNDVLIRLTGVARHARQTRTSDGEAPAANAALSAGEMELIALLPSRMTMPEIAAALGVTTNTIKTRTQRLFRKLSVQGRNEAVDVARQRGLVP